MASPDIITKRIHVGGLTPSITPSHIKDRFKSFGNVLQVEEMSEDGLGMCSPFFGYEVMLISRRANPTIYLLHDTDYTSTIEEMCVLDPSACEEDQELIKQGLSIMSGSMWRGCQLRLAEAKPNYEVK